MFAWLVWLVRCLAASFMLLLAVTFLVIGLADAKNRAFGLGSAAVLGVAGAFSWPRRPNAWRYDPPTQRQLDYAANLGIPIPRGVSKGELSDMISQVTGR